MIPKGSIARETFGGHVESCFQINTMSSMNLIMVAPPRHERILRVSTDVHNPTTTTTSYGLWKQREGQMGGEKSWGWERL